MKFDIIALDADLKGLEIEKSYNIKGADIYITSDGRYLIKEPSISSRDRVLYSQLMEALFLSLKPLKSKEDEIRYIEEYIRREAEELDIEDEVKRSLNVLKYYLTRDILGYGILDVPMNDDDIEEITAERYDRSIGVVHREYTQFNILDTNITFNTIEYMNSYVQKIMQRIGRSVTAAVPIVDGVTKEGDRIIVTYSNEISLPASTLSIRKFPRQPYVITDILKFNTMNLLMAAYIWMLIDAKAFGLIVGETGSGKTTLINALMCLSNPRWKVITIEETPELKIPHYRWQRMRTRSSAGIVDPKFEIDIMDLVRASMRMRPDFLIVGEVRGVETYTLFQSAATGHGGLTSFHASDPSAALNRLSAEPINIKASQQMLLWFIINIRKVQLANRKMGRRVLRIDEVIPAEDRVKLVEVFSYIPSLDRFDKDENNIDDLVRISYRVKEAVRLLNVDPVEDLKKRIEILKKCLDANASTVEEVFSIIAEYYS